MVAINNLSSSYEKSGYISYVLIFSRLFTDVLFPGIGGLFGMLLFGPLWFVGLITCTILLIKGIQEFNCSNTSKVRKINMLNAIIAHLGIFYLFYEFYILVKIFVFHQ